jgi:hypothetical protein
MGIRAACNAIAAGMLTCTTAFAQTSQTPTTTPTQTGTQPETSITLVGCLQREADYRREQASGRGGAVGMGTGVGNEFVLVNASMGAAGTSTPSATTEADCKPGGTGEAYELTGNRERELERFVGKRIEITGMLKRAETEAAGTAGTAGTAKPTGGFDPMGQDLRLHEVNVSSFRELGVKPPPPEPDAAAVQPEPVPAPEPVQPAPEPEPTGTSGVASELPQTASPLPLAGLIALFSFSAALGIHSVARRR